MTARSPQDNGPDDGGTDENRDDHDQGPEPEPEQERVAVAYGRGVRTALKNNATAYAFSISITSAYGLLSGTQPTVRPMETLSFAAAAAIAFVAIGASFVALVPAGSISESGQATTISGGADLLSVLIAVSAAFGLSKVPGFAAWPLTAFGTVTVFLLVGGFDVVLARLASRRTSFARSQ